MADDDKDDGKPRHGPLAALEGWDTGRVYGQWVYVHLDDDYFERLRKAWEELDPGPPKA